MLPGNPSLELIDRHENPTEDRHGRPAMRQWLLLGNVAPLELELLCDKACVVRRMLHRSLHALGQKLCHKPSELLQSLRK